MQEIFLGMLLDFFPGGPALLATTPMQHLDGKSTDKDVKTNVMEALDRQMLLNQTIQPQKGYQQM